MENRLQNELYENTTKLLSPYKNITKFLRMKSIDAVKHVHDGELDFIYIDARHDYCAVLEDLERKGSFSPKYLIPMQSGIER